MLRSIPELVWALVFVRVVGLGPTSGVLAIALTYGGMLGKVYGEILESGDDHASNTLLRHGASRLQALFYAVLPANAAELTSYTVYRWECAIRSSVVLGFVGAGGLGQQMDNSMKMFNGAEVSTMLLVFIGAGRAGRPCQRLPAPEPGMMTPTPGAASPLPLEGAPLAAGPSPSAAVAWLVALPVAPRAERLVVQGRHR